MLARRVDVSDVFFQIEIAAKALGAHATLIGLEIGVRVHVKLEIVNLMKRLGAYGALVLLVARVRELVIFVVALLVKALAAVLAHPRLKVLVYSHVRVQRRAAIERLAA